ncbi:MAG: DUF465 domain-containing protein [Acidobacteria bacterium]|nr:DUF465 domain-containing protein [Acidobacteriota bacterium]
MDRFTEEQTKAHLLITNAEYRDLSDRHHEYDEQLVALEAKDRLTYDEQMEEQRLKKLKLQTKDKMQAILSQHLLAAV